MPVMTGIDDCPDELLVPGVSPDVFRRACALAGDDARVPQAGFGFSDAFQHDIVFPAVAEIVLVDETIPDSFQQVGEASAAR